MRKILIDNDKGSALLISLLLMGMLTLLAIMAVRSSNTDMDLTFNQINADKTFYIAEAGAKRAVAKLNDDKTWNAGFSNIGFNGGTYDVNITDSSMVASLYDTVIVTSTGSTVNAQSAIEMIVAPEYVYPFNKAMFADDSIHTMNGMMTDSYNSDSGSYAATRDTLWGDVGTNGTVTLENGCLIGGNVSSSSGDSGIIVNGAPYIYGDTTSEAPVQVLDVIPDEEFSDAQASYIPPSGLSGDYTYNSSTGQLEVAKGTLTLSDGIYYFSSVILKNSASVEIAPGAHVVIYVEDQIEVKNSGNVNNLGKPEDLVFYSKGDIVLKNGGDVYGVFYSTSGSCDVRNSGQFYGSVVAEDIVIHNSANFHYDRGLLDFWKRQTGRMLPIAWREI